MPRDAVWPTLVCQRGNPMWFNPLIAAVLRSPFHGMLSRSVMLMTVTGRKSRAAYTTPVNYLPVGEELWTVSFRNRTWWRNLRGGAAVTLRLRGGLVQTTALRSEERRGGKEGRSRWSP